MIWPFAGLYLVFKVTKLQETKVKKSEVKALKAP